MVLYKEDYNPKKYKMKNDVSLIDQLMSKQSQELMKRENCIDFVRYLFAFFIIYVHYLSLADLDYLYFISGWNVVKIFFMISGFFVVYSYLKKPDLKVYASKRLRRIIPAYVLIVLLCFIAGIFLTTLPVGEYLTSSETYKYLFANLFFLNFIQPSLPGVFESDAMVNAAMNGSLWTMKIEVMFYVTVPIIVEFMRRWGKFKVLLALYVFSLIYDFVFMHLYEKTGNEFYLLMEKQIGGMFIYFYSTVAVLLYLDKVTKYMRYLYPCSLLICLLYFLSGNADIAQHISFLSIQPEVDIWLGRLYVIEPLAVSVLLIGTSYGIKSLNFFRKYDNITYGLYLFHYPVIQIFVYYGYTDKHPVIFLFITLFITFVMAYLSFKYIEKPVCEKRLFKKFF